MLEDTTKIKVKNTANAPIHIGLPESRFSRTWQPGAVYPISFDILREMSYDVGAKYFLDKDMLYIEDKEARLELGLFVEEPTQAVASTKKTMRFLNRSQMLKLWRGDSLQDFQEALNEISFEQMQALADFAVKEKIADFPKAEIFKKHCGIDIITALQLLQE